MALSMKSLNFAKKILKYNPPLNTKQCHNSQQQHQYTHQNCNHHHKQQQQQIKPYLHVHDHRKQRQIYQKPTQQKLQNMKLFKQQGNEHFKNKRYKQAIQFYQRIVIYSDYTFPQVDKEKVLMNELVQSANCNMGIAMNKLGESRKAIENFQQSANGPLQKIKIKSMYWLVKNYVSISEFQKARKQLDKLKSYGKQTQKQVEQLQKQLKINQDEYQKSRKNLYGQMFNNNQK